MRLTENDLLALIADKEAEGKTLDYKRNLVGIGETEKKNFFSMFLTLQTRKVVTSFSAWKRKTERLLILSRPCRHRPRPRNSASGTNVKGRHPATNHRGFKASAFRFQAATSRSSMQIPKSWNPPRQVTYPKSFRFYGRNTNGKYQLDVDELRSVFSLSASAAERLKLFCIERIAKIVAGDTPLPWRTAPK